MVAVVYGGPSAEASVSARSAEGVHAALVDAGYQVQRIELHAALPSELWDTTRGEGRFDVVFPVTHGPLGEDGCLQGLLEVLDLPYVGSDVRASAIAAHKPTAKVLFTRAGLPVADERVVRRDEDPAEAARSVLTTLGDRLVIKPASGGSAIGVRRFEQGVSVEELTQALSEALSTDHVLAERFHAGMEVTCGVLADEDGERALPPTLIHAKANEWYDFTSRYRQGGSDHQCPAPFDPELTGRVQSLALGAHRAVGARDLSRVDFVVAPNGQVTVLEVNTLPGMTATSNYPEAALAVGISFAELCDRLVRNALRRPRRIPPVALAIPS